MVSRCTRQAQACVTSYEVCSQNLKSVCLVKWGPPDFISLLWCSLSSMLAANYWFPDLTLIPGYLFLIYMMGLFCFFHAGTLSTFLCPLSERQESMHPFYITQKPSRHYTLLSLTYYVLLLVFIGWGSQILARLLTRDFNPKFQVRRGRQTTLLPLSFTYRGNIIDK